MCNLLFLSMPQIREHIEIKHQASKLFLNREKESWSKYPPTDFNCDQCRSVHTSRKALVRHVEFITSNLISVQIVENALTGKIVW